MVRAGLDEKNPDRSTQARPTKLGLQLGDELCQILQLQDPVSDRQTFNIDKKADVPYAKVWIIEADVPADGPRNLVAISELDFVTAR